MGSRRPRPTRGCPGGERQRRSLHRRRLAEADRVRQRRPLLRQQGEIAKAEADLRTQRVSLEKSRAQVTQEVRAAWAQFTSAHAQLERMDGRLQGRARRARDLIEIQYTKGAATLLDDRRRRRHLLAARAHVCVFDRRRGGAHGDADAGARGAAAQTACARADWP